MNPENYRPLFVFRIPTYLNSSSNSYPQPNRIARNLFFLRDVRLLSLLCLGLILICSRRFGENRCFVSDEGGPQGWVDRRGSLDRDYTQTRQAIISQVREKRWRSSTYRIIVPPLNDAPSSPNSTCTNPYPVAPPPVFRAAPVRGL